MTWMKQKDKIKEKEEDGYGSRDRDSRSTKIREGDTVKAKCAGWTKYYKGEITRVNSDDTFDIKFEDGDITKTPESQIHKAFNKTDVHKLFKFTGPAANPDVYKMFGHVRPKGVKEQFPFVTLIKTDLQIQYAYQDYFKSDRLLHWQSTKGTKEENEGGKSIINHKSTGKDIHLFVRTSSTAGRKFLYCGKINFLNGKGNGPFNVDFELETPIPKKISEEFVRVGI